MAEGLLGTSALRRSMNRVSGKIGTSGGGVTEARVQAMIDAALDDYGGGGGGTDTTAYEHALERIAQVVQQKTGQTVNPTDLRNIAEIIGLAIDSVMTAGSNLLSVVKFESPANAAVNNISEIAIGPGDGVSALSLVNDAFHDHTALTRISLPNTLTVIGADALRYTGIDSLTIPASVETVHNSAFRDCKSLRTANILAGVFSGTYIFAGCNVLERISIADTVSFTGIRTFDTCPALKGDVKRSSADEDIFTIPAATVVIPNGFCSRCINLSKVRFKGRVTSIGEYAFEGNVDHSLDGIDDDSHLDTLLFDHPESLTSIGYRAFSWCTSLVFSFTSAFSSLSEIRGGAFYHCTGLTDMFVPSNVTKVYYQAFAECASLQSVVIASGVQELEGEIFIRCPSLSSVTIPASITNMSENIFKDCPLLTSAGPTGSGANIIMNWSTGIPDHAFHGCASLIRVAFPAGITSIGYNAFDGTSLSYDSANPLVIPATVTEIKNNAFTGTSVANVTILNPNCRYKGNSFPGNAVVTGGIREN